MLCILQIFRTLHPFLKGGNVSLIRRDARVVEEARLESVYTPKAYRGFESRFLRIKIHYETQIYNKIIHENY